MVLLEHCSLYMFEMSVNLFFWDLYMGRYVSGGHGHSVKESDYLMTDRVMSFNRNKRHLGFVLHFSSPVPSLKQTRAKNNRRRSLPRNGFYKLKSDIIGTIMVSGSGYR